MCEREGEIGMKTKQYNTLESVCLEIYLYYLCSRIFDPSFWTFHLHIYL